MDCPTCGQSFETENGMKVHHAKIHNESISGVRVTCEWCGEDTRVERWRAERDGRTFCGVDCFAAWKTDYEDQVNKVEVECASCGSELEVWPYEDRQIENHFCGRDCQTEWKKTLDYEYLENSVTVECPACGEEFEKQRAKYERTDNHFCSQACFGEYYSGDRNWNYKGGWRIYVEGWDDEKKEAVRDRDGRECVDCGISQKEHQEKHNEKLHVHHIKPARDFEDGEGRNDMDNLVTLCRNCHLGKWEGVPMDYNPA